MTESENMLNFLKEQALKSNDKKLIKKLNSKRFQSSFDEVFSTVKELKLDINPEFDDQKEINLKISSALSQDYFAVYYIDLNTSEYISYSKNTKYSTLKIVETGKDFFRDSISNIPNVVYKKDVESVITNINKEKIINSTKKGKVYSFSYRLLVENKPAYVTLKAVRSLDQDNILIIGIQNVNIFVKKELEMKKEMAHSMNYTNIALALAKDYFLVYYVDINTSKYIEYGLDSKNQELIEQSSGSDFFSDTKMNARRFIVPEDQDKFLDALDRERLLDKIHSGDVFKLTYRQIINNRPIYVSLKTIRLSSDSSHFLIGVSSIDDEKKKEIEYKQKLKLEKNVARTDALTGASNRYSYNELEKEINNHINNKTIDQFAIVVCDINDLKTINDTLGHDAGDNYIKEAKNTIASIFKNSTVFRIGGDEFVLMIDGNDYYNRDYYLEKLKKINIQNIKNNKVVIACGISTFIPNKDSKVLDVFKRADEAMYENKKELKNISI